MCIYAEKQVFKNNFLGVPAKKAGGLSVENEVNGTPMKIKEK